MSLTQMLGIGVLVWLMVMIAAPVVVLMLMGYGQVCDLSAVAQVMGDVGVSVAVYDSVVMMHRHRSAPLIRHVDRALSHLPGRWGPRTVP
jgi:hypothetical protein